MKVSILFIVFTFNAIYSIGGVASGLFDRRDLSDLDSVVEFEINELEAYADIDLITNYLGLKGGQQGKVPSQDEAIIGEHWHSDPVENAKRIMLKRTVWLLDITVTKTVYGKPVEERVYVLMRRFHKSGVEEYPYFWLKRYSENGERNQLFGLKSVSLAEVENSLDGMQKFRTEDWNILTAKPEDLKWSEVLGGVDRKFTRRDLDAPVFVVNNLGVDVAAWEPRTIDGITIMGRHGKAEKSGLRKAVEAAHREN